MYLQCTYASMWDHSNFLTTMKNSCLFLLIVMMIAEAPGNNCPEHKREKRDLLLRSKRRWVLSTFELTEEDDGPFPKIFTTMFNDKTKLENDIHKFSLSGNGVTEAPMDVFSINETSGVVMVRKKIDRETYPIFHIKFDILNRETGKSIDKTLGFDVNIIDINDNPPRFKSDIMRAKVRETIQEGWLPVWLEVEDKDEANTINSTFTIRILSQEPKEPVLKLANTPNSKKSQLSFDGCFDYDKVKKYKVIVEAKDHGKPPLSSTAVIHLDIMDGNSHLPRFKEREYKGQVMEMETNKEVVRVGVEDKDTPNTAAWRAKYFFVKGNEDKIYDITTDPLTNEGILTVVKGRDFERTTNSTLQIGVENEEELFVCASKKPGYKIVTPKTDIINITVKVIDVNDPPKFVKKVTDVYQREEDEPGQKLFEPKISDDDSDVDKIRYTIIEDLAGWASIDPKTGIVHTVKKMDRESPFVDKANVYKIVVAAIDNGEPPATASSTILVHLRDINDHLPGLVNNSGVMCANKVNTLTVYAFDSDLPPFSGPFSFSLGSEDKELNKNWKIDPATGEEAGLVMLKSLPYGNYSVPLVIKDQQGGGGAEDVVMAVVICDCGGGDTCRGKLPASTNVGPSVIGLACGALLLFLLLLLLFTCECGNKFQSITISQSEGNQSLIMYNEEGGGSACKMEPTFHLAPISSLTMKEGQKQERAQMSQMSQMSQMYETTTEETDYYQSSAPRMVNSFRSLRQGQQRNRDPRESHRSNGGQSMSSTWNSRMMSARASTLLSDQLIAEHIDTKLYELGEVPGDYPMYRPTVFSHEGQDSRAQSLDNLSLDLGDDLEFLSDLGPKFKTLGGLCDKNLK
ncbi:cadherin-like protein 26 [Gadus morhua]|uniref:cadherin-like protein 26 n=1 Tax=Gadus morhua TaxID=8049 RepID=UPI0011B83777|nr:cadherin-like protein 26 [Gadus morhua]